MLISHRKRRPLAGKRGGLFSLEQTYTLTRPELFTVVPEDGKPCRGAHKEWYTTEWQQKEGCGPVTAATLLAYLACTHPDLQALYPSGSWEHADFTRFMEEVWSCMTPGKRGLNSLRLFKQGISAFAAQRHCVVHFRELDIPRFRIARPSFSQCAAFIRTGLAADCPVAFLNFCRTAPDEPDICHWVPIIAMETLSSGEVICTLLNQGEEEHIDLRLWYQTSRVGGGLVYLLGDTAT